MNELNVCNDGSERRLRITVYIAGFVRDDEMRDANVQKMYVQIQLWSGY